MLIFGVPPVAGVDLYDQLTKSPTSAFLLHEIPKFKFDQNISALIDFKDPNYEIRMIDILQKLQDGKYNLARESVRDLVIAMNGSDDKNKKESLFLAWKSIMEEEFKKRGSAEYSQEKEILARLICGSFALIEKDTKAVIDCFSEFEQLIQGPIIPNVAVVGERQVGFSDSDLMTTYDIYECVVIIIREESKGISMMAHVNKNNTEAEFAGTVRNFFERFGQEAKFTVRIFGALMNGGVNDSISQDNIDKVLSVLSKLDNVNIISADLTKECPLAITYHPKEDKVVAARGIERGEFKLQHQICLYQDLLRPRKDGLVEMSKIFDLTCNKERDSSIKIEEWFIEKLRQFCGLEERSMEHIYQAVQDRYPRSDEVFWSSNFCMVFAAQRANFEKSIGIQEDVSLTSHCSDFDKKRLLEEVLLAAKDVNPAATNDDIKSLFLERYRPKAVAEKRRSREDVGGVFKEGKSSSVSMDMSCF